MDKKYKYFGIIIGIYTVKVYRVENGNAPYPVIMRVSLSPNEYNTKSRLVELLKDGIPSDVVINGWTLASNGSLYYDEHSHKYNMEFIFDSNCWIPKMALTEISEGDLFETHVRDIFEQFLKCAGFGSPYISAMYSDLTAFNEICEHNNFLFFKPEDGIERWEESVLPPFVPHYISDEYSEIMATFACIKSNVESITEDKWEGCTWEERIQFHNEYKKFLEYGKKIKPRGKIKEFPF